MSISDRNYVYRQDFESEDIIINNFLNEGHIMVLGYPGIGKSTWVRAIAAKCIEQAKDVILLSPDQTTEAPLGTVEFIQIENRLFAIPIVKIPVRSTEAEDLLKAVVDSLSSLQKNLERVVSYLGGAHSIASKAELFQKITSKLNEKNDVTGILKTIQPIIQNIEQGRIGEIVTTMIDCAPYIGTIVKSIQFAIKWRREKKLEKLEERRMYVLIDDLADLTPNWQILSSLLSYEFRYLFVMRVQKPSDYLTMLNDKSYANDFIQDSGIRTAIHRKLVLPPPSLEIFSSILQSHKVPELNIERLWRYTGGIPAIAMTLWEQGQVDRLDELTDRISNILDSPSIDLSWTANNLDLRFAYATNAVKVIYEDLKSKNYAYALLAAAYPHALAADELALCCGYRFSEIYTCDNEHVKEVYDMMHAQHLYDEGLNVRLIDSPCIGCKCSHVLNESWVQEDTESWSMTIIERGQMEERGLPTVQGTNGQRAVYKYNNLFQHIPILLNEIATHDSKIRNELNKNRKYLLKIIEKEAEILKVRMPGRIISLASLLIEELPDLDSVAQEASIMTTSLLRGLPPLGIPLWQTLDRKITSRNQISQLDEASLLYALSTIARRYSNRDLVNTIMRRLELLYNSDDRKVLLKTGQCLANILSPNLSDQERFRELTSKLQQILSKLCSTPDALSAYAYIAIILDTSESYLFRGDFSTLQSSLGEVEKCLSQLTEPNIPELEWLNGPAFDVAFSLIEFEAQLNDIWAGILFKQDRLDEALTRYNKSREINKRINRYSNILQDDRQIAQVKIIKSDCNNFKSALSEMANLDRDLILSYDRPLGSWTDARLFSLADEDLSSAHSKAFFARYSLQAVFSERQEDKNILVLDWLKDQFYLAELNAGTTFLQKIQEVNIDIGLFMNLILSQLSRAANHDIPSLALEILDALETNHNYLRLEINGQIQDITIEEAKELITEQYDQAEEYRDSLYVQHCCKEYRQQSQEGILAEVVCTETFMGYSSKLIIFGITCHLLYDRYDCAINYIEEIAPWLSPLHRRTLNELSQALIKYKNSSTIERIPAAHNLVRAYIRYWYIH